MGKRSGTKSLAAMAVVLVAVIAVAVFAYRTLGDSGNLPGQTGSGVPQGSQTSQGQTAADNAVRLADFDAEVYAADGSSTRLTTIAGGKPLVINFWATWCPYCVEEMPDFQGLYERYGNRIEFAMIDAVGTRSETMQMGAAYVADHGFTFPVYYDLDGAAVKAYEVTGFPSTIVYDGNGDMVRYYVGRVDTGALDDVLASLR